MKGNQASLIFAEEAHDLDFIDSQGCMLMCMDNKHKLKTQQWKHCVEVKHQAGASWQQEGKQRRKHFSYGREDEQATKRLIMTKTGGKSDSCGVIRKGLTYWSRASTYPTNKPSGGHATMAHWHSHNILLPISTINGVNFQLWDKNHR